ncbi:glutathione S-transferase family protein [Chitinibacteraceae bacterium HSL-7]
MLTLYIGYKNYSSWSLRPWLLLKHFGVAFEEIVVDVAGRGASDMHRPYSDNGLVPCLHDEGFRVWDTLAIAEYLAETTPAMWPADRKLRARARSVSAEMHSGFGALRSTFPMNVCQELVGRPLSDEVNADVKRIVDIWRDARAMAAAAGVGGDFLFGAFSVADAMFAPVVWRFNTYNVALPADAAAYCATMRAHPAMQEWHRAAHASDTRIAHYDALATEFGGPRGE